MSCALKGSFQVLGLDCLDCGVFELCGLSYSLLTHCVSDPVIGGVIWSALLLSRSNEHFYVKIVSLVPQIYCLFS